jgi:ribonucleoside-diphosphate reductase beta chain
VNQVKFTANVVLSTMGYSKLYDSAVPLEFMERLTMVGKTSFFERVPTEYQKYGVAANGRPIFSTELSDF